MTPALDVAEPHQTVPVKRHNAFPSRDLVGNVLGGAFGYSCASL